MKLFPLCLAFAATIATAVNASAQDPVRVKLDTSEGAIVLELNAEKAPKTVENFLNYVKNDHYEGTVFHRVIDGFMIQGGGFTEEMTEKPTREPVDNEAGNGLKNTKYTIAMARKTDPHSATSQFFINTADNAGLNRDRAVDGYGYTVFGKVVEGTDVVDKIGKVATQDSVPARTRRGAIPLDDVPVEAVVIESAEVVEKK